MDLGKERVAEFEIILQSLSAEALIRKIILYRLLAVEDAVAAMAPSLTTREDLDKILAAARASRRKERTFGENVESAEQSGYVKDVEIFSVQIKKVRMNLYLS